MEVKGEQTGDVEDEVSEVKSPVDPTALHILALGMIPTLPDHIIACRRSLIPSFYGGLDTQPENEPNTK